MRRAVKFSADWESWRVPLRIAAREGRSSASKFFFVVLAVGVGVGVLTGVRSFSEAFRTMLLREARTLMAADLMVRSFDFPSDQQVAVMDDLASRGVDRTWITETVSMMSSEAVQTPVLVSVKAVDPNVYPYYGEVKLEPPGRLAETLADDSVAVSSDLLMRLEVKVGDLVRLGQEEFRVGGVVVLEPDRMTGSLNIGPRIMMTRAGLDRAGLIQTGSRASQRFLFRLPPEGMSVGRVRDRLEEGFGRALITDYRETHPRITRGLDRSTTFLSLVSLIAMIVGALGVAMAMHSHLQQRLDAIAIMKCIGGRSRQIIQIYLLQTLMLGLAGGLVGIAIGGAVQAMFPVLIERYFQLRPQFSFDIPTALQGLAIAELTTLLFTLPPLLRIRDIRPAVIFRREMSEARRSLQDRLRESRSSLGIGGLILLGIGAISAWVAGGDIEDAITTSLYFLGGLVVSLVSLSAIAWLLLRGLRTFLRNTPWRLPVALRHGIANLYRPGNHAQAVLVALGVGVMFTLTVYLIQDGLLAEMVRAAPKNMPNVFLINITDREREGLTELLVKQEGLESEPEIFASARARIAAVDGVPIGSMNLEGWARRFNRERSVTWRAEKPDQTEVIQGAWWPPGENARDSEPKLCVAENVAEGLGVQVGSRIDWTAAGQSVRAAVVCVHQVQEIRFGTGLDFVFSPGSLDGLPMTYFGGVRVRPPDVAAIQRAAYRAYPTVTVINAAEVLAIVQEVIDQVAIVIRFVALFAILAGVVILASSVAGTRFRRIREAAILKTLGATRKLVMAVFSCEFLILGSVAGLMGSLLASGFSRLLLTRMLDAPFRFDPIPLLVAVASTAIVATVAGWIVSFRILGQKPLEVLRNE
jgi:putative ABC transport system permease protein